MMLYWHALKYSADTGCNTFDFGRSTEGEGTFKFKKQWGAVPTPLNWWTFNQKRTLDEAQETKNYSAKKNLISQVWRKLPLPLANILGPKIRKYISL